MFITVFYIKYVLSKSTSHLDKMNNLIYRILWYNSGVRIFIPLVQNQIFYKYKYKSNY